MTERAKLLGFTALVTLSAGIANAQAVAITGEVTRNKIEAAYVGYEYIDIRYGLTQVKVEAVDNDTNLKVEAVYDKATGRLISTEVEAPGDDAGRSGVVTSTVTRDFEDDGRDDQTSSDDDDGLDDNTSSNDSTASDDDDVGDDSTSSNDTTSSDDRSQSDDSDTDDSTQGED